MMELLAPNGKPSNLTPEQYKLVRSKSFKEWFGDWENDPENASKVVDENGEPKVVWRGESKDFNVFEYKKLGSSLKTAWRNAGFYFSPTKSGAEQYMFFMGSRILKQFFLNIKNSYTLDSEEFFGVMDWGSLPTQKFKTNKLATDFAIKRISEIKSENYDGVFVTILENNNIVEIIAFEPNQIKLADGTNTTFDASNPDIRFSKGGELNKGGDCYYMAGQLILNNEFLENKIDYIGTPYLVHAEVQGQGAISNLRYGHAWIEDDVFVYDYSNNRKIVLPKDFYYRIGDIKTNNPKKYRKYNFEQAKRKMLETKNYGCWDLEVEYKNGGDVPNEIEKISKSVVSDLGEQYSENDYLGKCKEISEEIAVRLNKIKIEAIPMRIIDGEDKKYNSPVFNHAYTFLPKTNQIIDTQLWQLDGKPTDLQSRKVLFNWDDYNNLVELYEVEPISDWENRFSNGGEIIINPTEIECHKCHWHWKVKDGGDDLFICHKCYYDNTKFYKFEGLKGEKILDTISYKKGGRTISQTPAPKKDQIKGSDKNKEGSAKDLTSAKKIKFADDVLEKIQNSVDKHNEKHSNKKITIDSAKAVVRRGMGAYSSTHRPTISGGNENSRVAWGLARLNAFMYKIVNGKSKSGKYSQDDDLINELGYKVAKYEIGGVFHGSSYYFDKFSTNKIGSGIGQQQDGWGIYLTDDKESSKNYGNYIYETTLFKGKNLDEYTFIDINKPVKKDLVEKIIEPFKKLGFNVSEILEFDYMGLLFYKTLSRKLGGDKKASLFLLNNGIDGIKRSFENSEGIIYRTDYVIFDENAITIENKEHLPNNYYADGGDIQAYEEAMGISYAEGGEAKPKKVYVSITLDNDYERISGNLHLFKKYKDESFQELKNQKLVGVRGVSLSKDNVADWFVNRDCLIVMKYDEFILINDTTEIKYDDPYQLMANDLKIFSRLYSNSEYTDKKEKDITRRSNLGKILEKIPFYFDKAKYQYLYEDAQKRDELQRYYYIFADYRHNFIAWIIDNEYIINSPNDLTERLIEFAHLPNSESGIDNYRNFNLEKYALTTEDLLPIIIQGLKKAGSTYFDEKEVLINDKILNIPTNSQLFFKKSSFENSNLQEVIDRYNLKENYKVYSVDSKRLNDLQLKVMGDRSKIFMNKFEFGKEQLEIKKELVLNDLQKLFFDKSLDKINKILDEKYPSTYYFDWEGEETKYYRWNEVIEVQFLLNKFFEITLRDWKSVFKSKRANDIYSMSFFGIYNSIEHFLREFIEQNRDYLENINKYHNENGDYLWLYDIERAVLGVVSTTWDEGNGISDKQLAKKYFQMIGGELTSYYKQDEIVMPSIYKDGGESDEPTNFWGSEAGGVLVYCSTTDRYLILLRSKNVLEPNTWGIISGKLDDDETNVEDAVLREAEEETGYKLGNLIPSFIFEKPNFKFHNFVSIINEEFTPELNWENSHYKWVKLNEMPDNLHFGLKLLLQKEDLPKLVKKHQMENEILIVDMNMYRYNTSVNFKNKEIPLKLNSPKNEIDFIEWAEENNIEFEQWGDTEMIDSSWGYTFEIPLFKYIEYMKTEKFYTGGELKKGIKTEMEHKNTISKIKTGNFSVKQSAKMIAKDHLKENDKYYTNLSEMESNFEEGGKVISIKSKKGDIKISLDENWYSDDTKVELVPVSELIKFREFDRKVKPKYNQDNSRDNINHLKYMFQKDGVKEPLIIEYSAQDNSVLLIEGNHRINSAIDLGMEYLPARVVLRKYGKYSPEKLKSTMEVYGIKANSSNYIPSELKPSQIGIEGTLPITYAEGGIIEGRLHSECGDDGCGRKFQVGEDGNIIEAERDEAVIVAEAFDDRETHTIEGTPSEIASALNVLGGGKNFDSGAEIIENNKKNELLKSKTQAKETDVDDIIDSGSIIINRRSMADEKKYKVTGTTKQIASAINSVDGNGVVIEAGAEIKKIK